MYETDSSRLEEKNHIAGSGVAEDSEGPTAEGQWRGCAKPVNTKHQTGQNTQDPPMSLSETRTTTHVH